MLLHQEPVGGLDGPISFVAVDVVGSLQRHNAYVVQPAFFFDLAGSCYRNAFSLFNFAFGQVPVATAENEEELSFFVAYGTACSWNFPQGAAYVFKSLVVFAGFDPPSGRLLLGFFGQYI